jgi:hypothetical protein
MDWLKNYRKAVVETFSNDGEKTEETKKTKTPTDEWVWVEGYKGTDKDMKCRDFQFEFGATYSIPKDEVSVCAAGFHFCKELKDVYHYYSIGSGNRYFKVQALVRKADLDKYGDYTESSIFSYSSRNNKLVAAEIRFLDELTLDEIFKPTYASEWSDKHKKCAIEIGLKQANYQRRFEILRDLGYSETFARVIINSDKFVIAEAVGSQQDLSMDMKVWIIFTDNQ